MRWRFEHVFTLTVTGILGAALFGAFWMKDKDLIQVLIMPFTAALGLAGTFFFRGKDDNK